MAKSLQDIIIEWIGDDKEIIIIDRSITDGFEYICCAECGKNCRCEVYNKNLADLRSRVPELVEKLTIREARQTLAKVDERMNAGSIHISAKDQY